MTKVALKGDALGSGTVTLSAPNTNDNIEFELPVTGTHLASAQTDGMPLGLGGDPVVESGSNSDGEWTRWADGTQICSMLPAMGLAPDTTEELVVTLPRTFINTAWQAVTGSDTTAYSTRCMGNIVNTSKTTSSTTLAIYRLTGGSSSTLTMSVPMVIYGRWK